MMSLAAARFPSVQRQPESVQFNVDRERGGFARADDNAAAFAGQKREAARQ